MYPLFETNLPLGVLLEYRDFCVRRCLLTLSANILLFWHIAISRRWVYSCQGNDLCVTCGMIYSRSTNNTKRGKKRHTFAYIDNLTSP
ncbi:unnamed protein product [Periconia digitata]|uniref:Uncharacterized protein n=1 Tax=Periconia digitata TaxID=1303443 RepID=A0A9W4UPY6_9PLEO|nr:unnamed protein product [Periconia digitata]